MKLYNMGLNKLYETNPGMAEFANRHPIMMGIPTLGVGLAIGIPAKNFAERKWREFRLKRWQGSIEKATTETKAGRGLARILEKTDNKIFRRTLLFGVIGVGLAALAYRFIDAFGFGHRYKKARRDVPRSEVNPYLMKDYVAAQRYVDRFENRARRRPQRSTPVTQATQASKIASANPESALSTSA